MTILDYYARELGLNDYNSIVDKPMWVLGKGLQIILSQQSNTYISLSDVGLKIFDSHSTFLSDKLINNPTARPEYSTFERISKFIEDNINKKEHKKYLLGLLEVIAYSANIPFHVMKDHPKAIERTLIQKIVQKLSVLKNSENWIRDTPSLVELSNFFGIPRHTFDSIMFTKGNMLYRIFDPQELLTIAKILKSKLGPVDSKACLELLLEIGN